MNERTPPELLRRFRKNIYPPRLNPTQRTAVVEYLHDKGLEPTTGAVSTGLRLRTQNLVTLALQEINPGSRTDMDDIVVGPNNAGISEGISLYRPALRVDTPEA